MPGQANQSQRTQENVSQPVVTASPHTPHTNPVVGGWAQITETARVHCRRAMLHTSPESRAQTPRKKTPTIAYNR